MHKLKNTHKLRFLLKNTVILNLHFSVKNEFIVHYHLFETIKSLHFNTFRDDLLSFGTNLHRLSPALKYAYSIRRRVLDGECRCRWEADLEASRCAPVTPLAVTHGKSSNTYFLTRYTPRHLNPPFLAFLWPPLRSLS